MNMPKHLEERNRKNNKKQKSNSFIRKIIYDIIYLMRLDVSPLAK